MNTKLEKAHHKNALHNIYSDSKLSTFVAFVVKSSNITTDSNLARLRSFIESFKETANHLIIFTPPSRPNVGKSYAFAAFPKLCQKFPAFANLCELFQAFAGFFSFFQMVWQSKGSLLKLCLTPCLCGNPHQDLPPPAHSRNHHRHCVHR